MFAIATSILIVCIAFAIILTIVIIPKQKLNQALRKLDSGDYETAYALLKEIGNNDAIVESKYDRAMALIDSGEYETAYVLLEELGDTDAIAVSKHDRAVALIDSGDFEAGYALLEELGERDPIAANKYDRAMALIDSGDFEAAYILLEGLNYKDSSNKLLLIFPQYKKILLSKPQVGSYVYFNVIKVGKTVEKKQQKN